MDIEAIKKALEETMSKGLPALEKMLDEKLEARIKELGLDKVDKSKVFAKGDRSPEAMFAMQEKAAAFVKAVYNKDTAGLKVVNAEGKAMNEGTGSAGGFLVPEEFAAEIARIEEDYGLARKFARIRKMKSDTLNVPTLSTSVSVYWPGEATAGTASTPVFGNVALAAKQMVGITVYSNELLEDADVSVVQELTDLFAEAFAGEEDNQAFNGTGSPFTGILGNSSVTVVTMASGQDTFPELTLNDLRDLVANVKSSILPTAAFYMHRLVWNMVQKLTENSQHVSSFQNPIVPMGGEGGRAGDGLGLRPAGYLWGYPVYLSDKMPSTTAVSTKYVIFGSMQKGLFFGDRRQVTMKISEEGVVGGVSLFETSQAAIRITERVAITVGLPTAFAVLKTAAS